MEDYFLIQRIKAGDKHAFEKLTEKYYGSIYAFCYRKTGNRETSQDLTQDIFLKLVQSIYRYQCIGKFQNYLYTIAVNTCNDFLRKSRPAEKEVDTEELQDPGPLPEAQYIRKQDSFKLYDRLRMLPEIQREVLILYYYQNLKIKDIAAITGAGVSTVKSRMHQGIGKLRKLYGEEET